MSKRFTHSDAFAGILTNSEIHHFGGAHTNTEVAYFGKPIDKLFEIENMCYDQLGREVISITRLRELAEAERDGRVVVLPPIPKCDKRNGKFCGDHTEQEENEKDQCFHCCLLCDHAREMDCTFVCATAAEHFNPSEEASRALAEPKGEATT